MRIRNLHRSSPFVFTSSDALATVEASFADALISNTLPVFHLKSFAKSFNPAPVVLNYHRQNIGSQSNFPTSNPTIVGVTKPNDNADDGSDSAESMQAPPFPAMPKEEDEEEMEKLRVCTVNKSPWDVPSFVREFLTKPTTEPAEQSMQNNSRRRNNKKRIRAPLIQNLASHTKGTAEAKQQGHVEDDDGFNKTEIARLAYNRKAAMKSDTLPCGNEMLQVAEEEQVLESALVRVFSEDVAGLTVREAGCKLMLRNANTIISEGLPLSVQVRRAMLNSPYFVQLDDGRFALWDNFLNSTVAGRLDEKEINISIIEKRMGIAKFHRDEDCATYKEPAKELGLLENKLELVLPNLIRTKGKRSRRAGLGLAMNMRVQDQDEDKEEFGICKQADGNSFRQEIDQRSYNSVCIGNNSSSVECNNYSWDNGAVAASDSQYCYLQSISDCNGATNQNALPPHDKRDRDASSLISCINGNVGKNEFRPHYRKRKPVKARSLNLI